MSKLQCVEAAGAPASLPVYTVDQYLFVGRKHLTDLIEKMIDIHGQAKPQVQSEVPL